MAWVVAERAGDRTGGAAASAGLEVASSNIVINLCISKISLCIGGRLVSKDSLSTSYRTLWRYARNSQMKRILIAAAACSLLAPSPALALSHHGWAQAGSVARDGLVAVAFGLPAVNGDWQGVKQAGLSIGAAFAVTEVMKLSIHERRPDGSDNKSFPSGHASASFAAAAMLEKRYGWQVGVPAHLVAAFVGLSRVEAKKHFVGDVLVGAAIGEASGWLLSSKKNASVQWLPWGDAHGGGASVSMRF